MSSIQAIFRELAEEAGWALNVMKAHACRPVAIIMPMAQSARTLVSRFERTHARHGIDVLVGNSSSGAVNIASWLVPVPMSLF